MGYQVGNPFFLPFDRLQPTSPMFHHVFEYIVVIQMTVFRKLIQFSVVAIVDDDEI
jgi:hypothetical protein